MLERFKRWLKRFTEPPCDHKWTIFLEKYPSFTKDYWKCSKCGKYEVFENSEPPVKLRTAICSLGDVHIVNR